MSPILTGFILHGISFFLILLIEDFGIFKVRKVVRQPSRLVLSYWAILDLQSQLRGDSWRVTSLTLLTYYADYKKRY